MIVPSYQVDSFDGGSKSRNPEKLNSALMIGAIGPRLKIEWIAGVVPYGRSRRHATIRCRCSIL